MLLRGDDRRPALCRHAPDPHHELYAGCGRESCNGCGKCVTVCPVEAMTLVSANDPKRPRKKLARLDESRCLGCGVCVRACTKNASITLASRSQRVITPLNGTHRAVVMAIERGQVAEPDLRQPGPLAPSGAGGRAWRHPPLAPGRESHGHRAGQVSLSGSFGGTVLRFATFVSRPTCEDKVIGIIGIQSVVFLNSTLIHSASAPGMNSISACFVNIPVNKC